jgi:hypothetical protein
MRQKPGPVIRKLIAVMFNPDISTNQPMKLLMANSAGRQEKIPLLKGKEVSISSLRLSFEQLSKLSVLYL